MEFWTVVKIAKLAYDCVTNLRKDDYTYVNHTSHSYYESLDIARNYLDGIKDQRPSEVYSIIRSACQHLETAYATRFCHNIDEENDLILNIIRLHHVLEDDYSVIKYWAGKICPCSKPDKELMKYLSSGDYLELVFDYDEYEREKEEQWTMDMDKKVQDMIDYAKSNWGGFP
jgi:hypothetical protein